MYKTMKSEPKNEPNDTEETWISYREHWREIMENTENNNSKLSPRKSISAFKIFKYIIWLVNDISCGGETVIFFLIHHT